jgi:hypothetical protein
MIEGGPQKPVTEQEATRSPRGESLSEVLQQGIKGLGSVDSSGKLITAVNHLTAAQEGEAAHLAILDALDPQGDRVLRRMPEDEDPQVYREKIGPALQDSESRTVGELRRMRREVTATEEVIKEGAEVFPGTVKEVRRLERQLAEIDAPEKTTIHGIIEDGRAEVASARRRLENLPRELRAPGDETVHSGSSRPVREAAQDFTLEAGDNDKTTLITTSGAEYNLSGLQGKAMSVLQSAGTEGITSKQLAEVLWGDPAKAVNARGVIVELKKKFEQHGPQILSDRNGYFL